MTVFREGTGNSNGNTYDFQGREISCEGLGRRVVRYELDGSITVIADNYQGKHLNSPNDVVPHPDGSIWFTDPPYGGQLYEGDVDQAGGPTNANGKTNGAVGQPAGAQARAANPVLPLGSKWPPGCGGHRGPDPRSERNPVLA